MKKEHIEIIGKIALPLVVLIIVLVIVKKIGNKMTASSDKAEKETKQITNGFVNEVTKNHDKTKQTFTESQIKRYVVILFNALSGAGTDEAAIENVFESIQTDDDLRGLIKAYGVRDEMDLVTAIHDDIDQSNMIGLSINDLNEILEEKNLIVRV